MSEVINAPKVIIIENDLGWQEDARIILKGMGIDVVAIVDNITEAMEDIIPNLEKLGVLYVLLDANLSDESNGQDGQDISAQIKKQAPSVKTIGFSAVRQSYVDFPMGKRGFSEEALREIIFPD